MSITNNHKNIVLLQNIVNNTNIYRREFIKSVVVLSLATMVSPTILFSSVTTKKKKWGKWIAIGDVIREIVEYLLSLREEEQEKVDFDVDLCIECGACLDEFPGNGIIGNATDVCPVDALRKEK